jgi:hypothetical protein
VCNQAVEINLVPKTEARVDQRHVKFGAGQSTGSEHRQQILVDPVDDDLALEHTCSAGHVDGPIVKKLNALVRPEHAHSRRELILESFLILTDLETAKGCELHFIVLEMCAQLLDIDGRSKFCVHRDGRDVDPRRGGESLAHAFAVLTDRTNEIELLDPRRAKRRRWHPPRAQK